MAKILPPFLPKTEEQYLLNVLNETDNEEICLTEKIVSNLVRNDRKETLESTCEEEKELFTNYFVEPEYLEEEIMDHEVLNDKQNFEVKEKINILRICSVYI